MRHSLKIVVFGLALIAPVITSIAAAKSPKLARCDGKQRRPANVHGSILPTVDPVSGTVAPASATQRNVDVFPQAERAKRKSRGVPPPSGEVPAPQVPPISAVFPSTPYQSC